MSAPARWLGALALAGLAAVGPLPAARAQRVPLGATFGFQNRGIASPNPTYYLSPNLRLSQYLGNTVSMGQASQFLPPSVVGPTAFNSYPPVSFGPYSYQSFPGGAGGGIPGGSTLFGSAFPGATATLGTPYWGGGAATLTPGYYDPTTLGAYSSPGGGATMTASMPEYERAMRRWKESVQPGGEARDRGRQGEGDRERRPTPWTGPAPAPPCPTSIRARPSMTCSAT